MRPVVLDPGLLAGDIRRPGQGGFVGTGVNISYEQRRQLDAHVEQQHGDGRARRHELLPQHHRDAGNGLTTAQRRRHSGREPRRVHERHLADQPQQRLHEPGPRVLGQPALGSLGEDLQRRRHDHRADDATTPSSSAASSRKNTDSCCRRRTPAARAATSPSTPAAPACRPRRRRRAAAQLACGVPARLADHGAARPEGHRRAGHAALGVAGFVHDKWQIPRR